MSRGGAGFSPPFVLPLQASVGKGMQWDMALLEDVAREMGVMPKGGTLPHDLIRKVIPVLAQKRELPLYEGEEQSAIANVLERFRGVQVADREKKSGWNKANRGGIDLGMVKAVGDVDSGYEYTVDPSVPKMNKLGWKKGFENQKVGSEYVNHQGQVAFSLRPHLEAGTGLVLHSRELGVDGKSLKREEKRGVKSTLKSLDWNGGEGWKKEEGFGARLKKIQTELDKIDASNLKGYQKGQASAPLREERKAIWADMREAKGRYAAVLRKLRGNDMGLGEEVAKVMPWGAEAWASEFREQMEGGSPGWKKDKGTGKWVQGDAPPGLKDYWTRWEGGAPPSPRVKEALELAESAFARGDHVTAALAKDAAWHYLGKPDRFEDRRVSRKVTPKMVSWADHSLAQAKAHAGVGGLEPGGEDWVSVFNGRAFSRARSRGKELIPLEEGNHLGPAVDDAVELAGEWNPGQNARWIEIPQVDMVNKVEGRPDARRTDAYSKFYTEEGHAEEKGYTDKQALNRGEKAYLGGMKEPPKRAALKRSGWGSPSGSFMPTAAAPEYWQLKDTMDAIKAAKLTPGLSRADDVALEVAHRISLLGKGVPIEKAVAGLPLAVKAEGIMGDVKKLLSVLTRL